MGLVYRGEPSYRDVGLLELLRLYRELLSELRWDCCPIGRVGSGGNGRLLALSLLGAGLDGGTFPARFLKF